MEQSKRRIVMGTGRIAVAILAMAGLNASVLAAEDVASWPSKPIRMLIASDAGSGSDVAGRLVSNALTASLGRPVVVENVAGAGGSIAASRVAHSAPDGYTVLSSSPGATVLYPILRSDLNYKVTDLAPVGEINESINIIAINPSTKATTLQELIALLKQNPGKFNYGSSGIGNTNHLQTLLFLLRTGTSMVHVPFGGGAASIAALLSNQIQFNLINTTGGLNYLTSGTLRPLAVIAKTRIPELPDVPAIQEIVPDMDVNVIWQGNFVARGTPKAIVDKLSAAMAAYLHSADGIAQMKKIGSIAVGSTPEEFGKVIQQDTATWTEVIQRTGSKFE
jgi:tripartite-type tricarboxylate transporter receptor subunit TctC